MSVEPPTQPTSQHFISPEMWGRKGKFYISMEIFSVRLPSIFLIWNVEIPCGKISNSHCMPESRILQFSYLLVVVLLIFKSFLFSSKNAKKNFTLRFFFPASSLRCRTFLCFFEVEDDCAACGRRGGRVEETSSVGANENWCEIYTFLPLHCSLR